VITAQISPIVDAIDSRHFRAARIVHVHELPRAGHQESLVCAGSVTPSPHDRAPVVDTKGQRIRRPRHINGRILATLLDEPVLRVARICRVAYDLSLTIDADGNFRMADNPDGIRI